MCIKPAIQKGDVIHPNATATALLHQTYLILAEKNTCDAPINSFPPKIMNVFTVVSEWDSFYLDSTNGERGSYLRNILSNKNGTVFIPSVLDNNNLGIDYGSVLYTQLS